MTEPFTLDRSVLEFRIETILWNRGLVGSLGDDELVSSIVDEIVDLLGEAK